MKHLLVTNYCAAGYIMLLFVTKIKITEYCTYSSRSDKLWYARPTIEIIAASGRGNKRCYRYDYLDCSVPTVLKSVAWLYD